MDWLIDEPEPQGDATETDPMDHEKDSDCTLDADGSCVDCGVYHGEPALCCGGRGFHAPGCPESDS